MIATKRNKIIQLLQNVKCMSRKSAEKAEMENSHTLIAIAQFGAENDFYISISPKRVA